MIRFLHNIPIQRKLMLIILLSCSVALLGAFAVLTTVQFFDARKNFARDISTLADAIASNTTAAVAFNDPKAGQEVLAAFHANAAVRAASVWLPGGEEFCHYEASDALSENDRTAPRARFTYDGLTLRHLQPIVLDHEQIGTLYVRSDFAPELRHVAKVHLLLLVSVLGGALLIAYLISRQLQRTISRPISKLAETAAAIAERKDYSVRAEKFERDEVGAFTDAFNHMLNEIQRQDAVLRHEIHERKRAEQEVDALHKQVLATSRQAGMAEVATSVLHNVGNVLNSVNISTTLLAEHVRKSRGQNVTRLAELLQSHAQDLASFVVMDPKGRALPNYLAELGQRLEAERTSLLEEIESLGGNIEHIKEIVAMQQSYARVSGVVETLPLADVVEDAIRMNAAGFARHGVIVERDFAKIAPVALDKHKTLQVLTNILRNAKYAVDEAPVEPKIVRVRICETEDGLAAVAVTDNGVGIAPENLTRIFGHGFTTRKDGHGFGLHSGALAAREMGGSLTAHSEGLGRGATFTFTLPLAESRRELSKGTSWQTNAPVPIGAS